MTIFKCQSVYKADLEFKTTCGCKKFSNCIRIAISDGSEDYTDTATFAYVCCKETFRNLVKTCKQKLIIRISEELEWDIMELPEQDKLVELYNYILKLKT